MLIPLIIMIAITAMFVRGIVRYVSDGKPHNCNKYAMYFEDHDSRGLFCNICNRDISIEYYSTNKGK
jgi:hypothetical protein